MSERLNVIALISGGKDSLYSALHCLENGHRITALANLYPQSPAAAAAAAAGQAAGGEGEQDGEAEDLNSFMYQTVGHSVVPLYAECLGLPLYRRAITGAPVQTGRYYDASSLASAGGAGRDDETEDLVPLLREVLRQHPEANAVCSGAILSTYQRTRVESVAVRLGLTALAYLWQYPALPPPRLPAARPDSLAGLLEDMDAARCDARLIKIASGGIPESLVGSNVADPRSRSRLVGGLAPFFDGHEFGLRGAVLGEGGEYESLAVNGPRPLWKKRIEIPAVDVDTVTLDGGVHYAKLVGAKVVEQDNDSPERQDEAVVRVPGQLDEQFQKVLLLEAQPSESGGQVSLDKSQGRTDVNSQHGLSRGALRFAESTTSSNLTLANLTVDCIAGCASQGLSATEQMERIVGHVKETLSSRKTIDNEAVELSPSNITSTVLLLRDISDFAKVNAVYSSLFRPGEPNPPARVTFSCQLPAGVEVSLTIIVNLGPRRSRRGLHVQSRSYWAPANIGPYSQAICEPHERVTCTDLNVDDAGLVEVVHVAGQIPLLPQSMGMFEAPFLEQAVLGLQHLWRIGQERGIDLWPWGISLLKQDAKSAEQATAAYGLWRRAHLIGTRPTKQRREDDDDDEDEQQDGPDAWDLRFNHAAMARPRTTIGEHLHPLPNANVFPRTAVSETFVPPFIAAAVTALPRDAPVEWWSLGVANLPKWPESKSRVVSSTRSLEWGSITVVTIEPTTTETDEKPLRGSLCTRLVTVTVEPAVDLNVFRMEQDLFDEIQSGSVRSQLGTVHGTAFIASEFESVWAQVKSGTLLSSLTVVPCRYLAGGPAMTIDHKNSEFSSRGVETARRRVPECTDRHCQPLALAVTLRAEQWMMDG